MNNSQHNRFFAHAKGDLWAKYDAQPLHVKEWLMNFPEDLWPPNFSPASAASMAQAERLHLAGLRDVWGPDHPAVIDAAKQVAVKRGKVMPVADLDDYF